MKQLLNPTKKYLIMISLCSYIALALIFLLDKTKCLIAYCVYVMSAYSLIIICLAFFKKIKKKQIT